MADGSCHSLSAADVSRGHSPVKPFCGDSLPECSVPRLTRRESPEILRSLAERTVPHAVRPCSEDVQEVGRQWVDGTVRRCIGRGTSVSRQGPESWFGMFRPGLPGLPPRQETSCSARGCQHDMKLSARLDGRRFRGVGDPGLGVPARDPSRLQRHYGMRLADLTYRPSVALPTP